MKESCIRCFDHLCATCRPPDSYPVVLSSSCLHLLWLRLAESTTGGKQRVPIRSSGNATRCALLMVATPDDAVITLLRSMRHAGEPQVCHELVLRTSGSGPLGTAVRFPDVLSNKRKFMLIVLKYALNACGAPWLSASTRAPRSLRFEPECG